MFGGIDKRELSVLAESVANQFSLDKNTVIEALEKGFERVARDAYGHEAAVRAVLQSDGSVALYREFQIVELVTNAHSELTPEQALERSGKQMQVSEVLREELPQLKDMGPAQVRVARAVFLSNIKQATRRVIYAKYKDKVGQLVTASVSRTSLHGAWMLVDKDEAFMPKECVIPRENIISREHVLCYIYDVRDSTHGPQVLLSRTHTQFLRALLEREIPEVQDGTIQIMSIAWIAGFRAKVAVSSRDITVDPVGTCVGFGGARIRAIMEEICNDRVDIINWSDDQVKLLANSMQHVTISHVSVHKNYKHLDVTVPASELQKAIGAGGKNVRLATKLLGVQIKLRTEEEYQQHLSDIAALFVQQLDVDDDIGQLLAVEGYLTIQDIIDSPMENLKVFQDNPDLTEFAREINLRAEGCLEEQRNEVRRELVLVGVSEELLNFDRSLTLGMVQELAKEGVKTLEGFSRYAVEELIDEDGTWQNLGVSPELAEDLLVKARQSV